MKTIAPEKMIDKIVNRLISAFFRINATSDTQRMAMNPNWFFEN